MRAVSTKEAAVNLSTAHLHLQELVRMGVDNIITFDAHDPRVQNAIPLSGFETVPSDISVYQRSSAQCQRSYRSTAEHMMVDQPG